MLKSLSSIITWYNRHQENKIREHSEALYNKGFKWAMTELVQNTLTSDEICYKCGKDMVYNDFDLGALNAISVYRSVEIAAAAKLEIIQQSIVETRHCINNSK